MPLLDHFHPPLSKQRHWDSFHGAWAEAIARHLNEELLPERYYAEARVKIGTRIEIDVATHEERNGTAPSSQEGGVAVWAPPRPTATAILDFADIDIIEIQVFNDEEGPRLIAAIELVSPANKDRAAHRDAFAIKCASYLQSGVSLVMVDVVTDRHANLHAELLRLLKVDADGTTTQAAELYACAYRAQLDAQPSRMDLWCERLAIGAAVPTLPLWLTADFALPLNLEQTYASACTARRISLG